MNKQIKKMNFFLKGHIIEKNKNDPHEEFIKLT